MRDRLVSAGAFGLAALLVGLVVVLLLDRQLVAEDPLALASALMFAVPAVVSGFLFAPLVTRGSSGTQAVVAGIGVTVASAFLFGVELALVGRLMVSVGTSVLGVLRVLAIGSSLALFLGAVTGWCVWRWLRRDP